MRTIPLLVSLLLSCSSESVRFISGIPEIGIPEIYIPPPKLKTDESKELSSYSTKFAYKNGFEPRAHNIRLAASKLNGYVLESGEEFSFNDVIGERSADNGYKEATVLFLGQKQKGLGGGICQVSSTLYATVMFGGLEVTQRTSHSRPSTYIPLGMDATVSYPNLNLKFKNNYDVPLMIRSSTKNGELFIKILGKDKEFSHKHYFIANKPIEFEKREISTIYHKGPPKQTQKGKNGTPGIMYWEYMYENGIKRVERAFCNYKPVPEIWYYNPKFSSDENINKSP